jgi:hypothetical protein
MLPLHQVVLQTSGCSRRVTVTVGNSLGLLRQSGLPVVALTAEPTVVQPDNTSQCHQ